MGVQLFSRVANGDFISDTANFRTFWSALLLLIRSSTGESWNGIMHDCAAVLASCDVSPAFDATVCGFSTDAVNCIPLNGCGSPVAYAYFISFTLIVTFVMVNLFIAVILDQFAELVHDEEHVLSSEQMEEFKEAWNTYDPVATHTITLLQLSQLLADLPPPMGLTVAEQGAPQRVVADLHLPTFEGDRVHFVYVLDALARRVVWRHMAERGEALEDLPDTHTVRVEIAKKASRTMKLERQLHTSKEVVAVLVLQTAFRRARFRRKMDATRQRRLEMRRLVEAGERDAAVALAAGGGRRKLPPL
eukprot:PLAT7020.31.p2 GENE.PLAT7020.31~~PLAT7020.31.p2  ORF type:complete len:315 (-),score=176.44 PLAT7020.31:71-982(-)